VIDSWRFTQIVAALNTLRESLQRSVDRIVDRRRPTRPAPTDPGPGRPRTERVRTRPNRPTPARNRPTGSNPPTANRPMRLGETSPGAGRPGATNSTESGHTTADALTRPPAPDSPGWTLLACNSAHGPRPVTRPVRPNGGRVEPSQGRSATRWRSRPGPNGSPVGIDNRETDSPSQPGDRPRGADRPERSSYRG
jgi:hypothetical protein